MEIKEEEISSSCDLKMEDLDNGYDHSDKELNEEEDGSWMEIGTWSNEMAEFGDEYNPNSKLPANLSMVMWIFCK